jgi:hypothetical protein
MHAQTWLYPGLALSRSDEALVKLKQARRTNLSKEDAQRISLALQEPRPQCANRSASDTPYAALQDAWVTLLAVYVEM